MVEHLFEAEYAGEPGTAAGSMFLHAAFNILGDACVEFIILCLKDIDIPHVFIIANILEDVVGNVEKFGKEAYNKLQINV